MIARALVTLIGLYQRRGGGGRYLVECNFLPTCSAYAKKAIRRHGAAAGLRLAIGRLRRCSDPNRSDKILDPVPVVMPHV
jgi:putative component of membrane protein insertase Oxa1/YidC/SpoIIIJ protein YidD